MEQPTREEGLAAIEAANSKDKQNIINATNLLVDLEIFHYNRGMRHCLEHAQAMSNLWLGAICKILDIERSEAMKAQAKKGEAPYGQASGSGAT